MECFSFFAFVVSPHDCRCVRGKGGDSRGRHVANLLLLLLLLHPRSPGSLPFPLPRTAKTSLQIPTPPTEHSSPGKPRRPHRSPRPATTRRSQTRSRQSSLPRQTLDETRQRNTQERKREEGGRTEFSVLGCGVVV